MTEKKLPKREYHDGDIVEFDFEPNSLDIYWHKVTIIGVITGVLYEKDGTLYKVQLRDSQLPPPRSALAESDSRLACY